MKRRNNDWRETLEQRPTENKEKGVIYAVNKRTKEHIRVAHALDGDATWSYIEVDPDGWIEWDGDGECPLPSGSRCEYRMHYGETDIAQSGELRWSSGYGHTDIIAYRPILDADTKPEPPEWDGEGLPPVGCECEWKHKRVCGDQWVPCQIVGYHDEWVFVVDGSNSGMPAVKKAAPWRFRPIRSEEDRQIEEMARIMYDCDAAGNISAEAAAEALYRAGYRKVKESTDD